MAQREQRGILAQMQAEIDARIIGEVLDVDAGKICNRCAEWFPCKQLRSKLGE